MQTYETLQPVRLTLSLGFVGANVHVTASKRTDTVVDVTPADPTGKADVRVAEQTHIEQAGDQILVHAPKLSQMFGRSGTINVTVTVPTGSSVQGESGMGSFTSDGRLGDCQFKTGFGPIAVDEAETAALTSAGGDVTTGRVSGRCDVTTARGALRLHRIDGPATIKNTNGTTWIGDVGGDLRVVGANGPIEVDRAHASATMKTANGSVRIGEVFRGEIVLETAAGGLEVGVHDGVAAWLDLSTVAGRVHNELGSSGEPAKGEDTVSVRARTYVGDIVVRRATMIGDDQ